MPPTREPRMPPRLKNHEGELRHVGVELEFAAVGAELAANRIAELFGGEIRMEDAHRYHVTGTRFGDFVAELDTQYAHKSDSEPAGNDEGLMGLVNRVRSGMREAYGDVGSLVIPYEVVCPPIPMRELGELEKLLDKLRDDGATGTRDNLLHAFGAQFNPEIATTDPGWILAVLKAQILMSDWLRAVMSPDTTRKMLSFADQFPADYAALVLDAAYWPDLETLIGDYLKHNATRDREIDMLPLFAWFDESRIKSAVKKPELIKKRPTFHYRLPDANISQPDWNLTLEWNRWVLLENLAEDRECLAAMGEVFLRTAGQRLPGQWAAHSTEWLMGVR